MLTEENLMDARYEIVLLREKQDKLFNKLLKKIKKHTTIIMVTHRNETLDIADKVIEIN